MINLLQTILSYYEHSNIIGFPLVSVFQSIYVSNAFIIDYQIDLLYNYLFSLREFSSKEKLSPIAIMADVEEASQVPAKEAAPANVVEEPLDLVRLSLDERIYVKVSHLETESTSFLSRMC